MREMKNSGIEWIGDISSDWNIIKLCYVVDEIFLGKTPIYSEEQNENYTLGQKNNQSYGLDFNGIKFSTDEHFNACKESEFLRHGDILLNSLGTGSVGRIGFFDLNKRMLTDGHIIVIRPNNKINNKFLFYFLRTLRKKFEDDAVGSTNQSFLTVPKIYKIFVPFPTQTIQNIIVTFLDEKCAEIDTVIEKTKATIEEYKNLKQSVITQAVTKGTRPNRPMKDSGIEWIGEIPEEWKINTAFQIFTQVKNKNVGLVETNLLSLSYGKIKRKSIDTIGGLLPESFDGYNIIEADDIVLRLTDLQNDHTSLRVGLSTERGIVTSAYLTLRNRSENLPMYLYYYLHSFDVAKGFYGMGAGVRQGLNWDGLKRLKIISPSVQEQQEIINYLEKKCSEIDELIAKKTALLSELESYKKSLIYEYVTGKKEVK